MSDTETRRAERAARVEMLKRDVDSHDGNIRISRERQEACQQQVAQLEALVETTALAKANAQREESRAAAENMKAIADQTSLRANRLADECGRLHDQVRELEVENCQLRRKVERLERKR